MTLDDIAAVTAIERASFSAGWPKTAFEHELKNNAVARYLVLERKNAVLGFAGIWLMLDEAHVVTVAVLPSERRRGFARRLVLALLDRAVEEGMTNATLECRVSNEAARSLYREFGFHEVGTRKRYYEDNGEDAVIMTTEAFDAPHHRSRIARIREALAAPADEASSRLARAITESDAPE